MYFSDPVEQSANQILLMYCDGLNTVGIVMNRVSAVLSQYITKGLERWNLSTDADIDKKYVYLDWKVFVQNQQKYRPNDKSLQYSESEFTKHNHLYELRVFFIHRLSISLGNRPRSVPSLCFIVRLFAYSHI